MTWLQFLVGTDGMAAIAKHGLIGVIREGICNFGFSIIIGLLFLVLLFAIGNLTYDYIKIVSILRQD